jgi:type VI secretion system secreted protein Hcp
MNRLPVLRALFTRRVLPALVTALALAAATLPSRAQPVDTFMKIDGLPGESTNAAHPGEIDLTGWSQTFGTRHCSRAVAVKRVDRASPGLIARAAANTLIPQVVVSMARSGGGRATQDFFRATLDLVTIERVEIAEQGDELVERVVLAPRSIRLEYRPQMPDGSFGAPVATAIACTPERERDR